MWGGCNNSDIFSFSERLYCRAARTKFSLPRNTPFAEVQEHAKWSTLYFHCKLKHLHGALNTTGYQGFSVAENNKARNSGAT